MERPKTPEEIRLRVFSVAANTFFAWLLEPVIHRFIPTRRGRWRWRWRLLLVVVLTAAWVVVARNPPEEPLGSTNGTD